MGEKNPTGHDRDPRFLRPRELGPARHLSVFAICGAEAAPRVSYNLTEEAGWPIRLELSDHMTMVLTVAQFREFAKDVEDVLAVLADLCPDDGPAPFSDPPARSDGNG